MIKPGSDPFKELIDRRLNESAQPDYNPPQGYDQQPGYDYDAPD